MRSLEAFLRFLLCNTGCCGSIYRDLRRGWAVAYLSQLAAHHSWNLLIFLAGGSIFDSISLLLLGFPTEFE